MKSIALFLLLLGIWLVWSGLYQPLLIGLGVVSCLLSVWVTRRMHVVSEPFVIAPLLRIVGYLPWLLKEIAAANWLVIRIVLSPRLDLRPVIVTLRGTQRSAFGRVIYGNSITLTPGTLTMDLHGDRFTVHALTADGARQLRAGEMNDRVARLEGPA